MGKIRQLREDILLGNNSQDKIYPITYAKAVYSKDRENLQDIIDSIREGNFLKDGSIKTRHLKDKAVTTSKLDDGSVDNRVLAIDAVTYDKLKDRAVTTEKVEEKAITNPKLGDQSVDGRVVREASIEGKHLVNNSVTNEKIAHNSVSRAELTPDVRSSIDKKADAEQVNNSLYNLEKRIGDRFVVEGDVTNLPDEEDLTSVKESEHDVLKLADRSYAPENFSGKGYKILRRNIKSVSIAVTKIQIESAPSTDGTLSFTINGKETQIVVSATTDNTAALVAEKVASALQKSMTEYDVSIDAPLITLTRKSNGSVTPSIFSARTTGVVCNITDSTKREFRNILTQDMINQPNTIYEIRYDFNLDGKNIKVPDNSVLKFVGGRLINGELNPNGCNVVNDTELCIFYNILFTKYTLFNESLLFQDYWIDNIFKSCILGHINNFNITKSHECSTRNDFGAESINLSDKPLTIYGNNNTITFNTDKWTKLPGVSVKFCYATTIIIYDLKLIQEQPTNNTIDLITVYFNSKIFRFINSYYFGYCRLNVNWSFGTGANDTNKGIGSELSFINSTCKQYGFVSEGRFDKVIIRDSSILKMNDRPDIKNWTKECLSIGGNSVGYTNKNDCYMHITNSQLASDIEEVSRNYIFNENGDSDAAVGWDGISNKGYTYILVENCNLDHSVIVPQGACNNGKWCVYSTTVEFRNCKLYDSRTNTNNTLSLNGHNKYIFNNCILYVGFDIHTAHEVTFCNCMINNCVTTVKNYKLDKQELNINYYNCVFNKYLIRVGDLYTFSEGIEHFNIHNCYNESESEFEAPIIIFSDKITAYLPVVNLKFITADCTKDKAVTKKSFIALAYNYYTLSDGIYKKKLVYYDPYEEGFRGLDETNEQYVTY